MSASSDYSGEGGGVRVGWRHAATLAAWTLDGAGPGLYVLRADVPFVIPALLAFGGLTLWIPQGALRWSWAVDEVSIVNGRLEAVLGQPSLGPLGR